MLEELKKPLEKQIVRTFVASPSYATSQTRKQLTEERLKQAKHSFKQENTTFTSSLSSSAKGKWVDSAKQATNKVISTFSWL